MTYIILFALQTVIFLSFRQKRYYICLNFPDRENITPKAYRYATKVCVFYTVSILWIVPSLTTKSKYLTLA